MGLRLPWGSQNPPNSPGHPPPSHAGVRAPGLRAEPAREFGAGPSAGDALRAPGVAGGEGGGHAEVAERSALGPPASGALGRKVY